MKTSIIARSGILAAFVVGTLAWGCGPRNTPERPFLPGDTIVLEIGSRTLEAEVAFDAPSRHKGLMYREELPEDRGMLFVFPRAEEQSFYMRNTYIPLSIAFIDEDGTILQIEDMRPKDESSVRSKYKVRYALEVNRGWFEKAGVREGDRIPGFRDKVAAIRAR